MGEVETAGTILARTAELMRGNALAAAIGVVMLAAFNAGLDTQLEDNFALNMLISTIVGTIVEYALLAAAMRKLGLIAGAGLGTRLLAGFGLVVITTLATILGYILLIVPGVLLSVRWWPSVSILLAERTGIGAALRLSWRRTKGRFWPICGVGLIFSAVLIIFAVASVFTELEHPVALFLFYAVDYCAIFAMWYATIAVYEGGRSEIGDLEQVFT